MYTLEDIQAVDMEVANAITDEFERQNSHIELIASENWVSKAVMSAMGSVLTNKYAEGYPGKRYYGGCECVDVVEELARERAKELFGCEYANVQPHSGAQANMAVQFAILKPGDTVMGMNLDHGGHLTHGSPVNFSGTYFHIVPYGVNDEGFIDYDKVEEIAMECKPKMIIAGASAYARTIDFKRFREIADACGAVLMVDMAHIAGLVAAGLHPSPIPYAHVVTTTTHKTLRGPRGGMILSSQEIADKYNFNKAIFPGIQGGPLMHVIAAKAVCFKEALQPEFKVYQQNIIDNAQALCKGLLSRDIKIVSGGTDNHLMLVDLTNYDQTGKAVEKLLDSVNITCNKNTIPNDPKSPFVTSGVRLGTPAVTSRGLNTEDMDQIAEAIGEPTDVMCESIMQDAAKTGCKRIIAIGGGTVIDIAKALAVATEDASMDSLYSVMPALTRKYELVIIPTTCGTGSEVTNIAVFNRTRMGTKMGLVGEAMYADKAVLIPELLSGLPFGVFATSSIDALVHAVESCLSPNATSYTKLFGYKAIEMIVSGYKKIVTNGRGARLALLDDFLVASNYAGIAFGTAGCGTVHAMAYPLGGQYHVAHGESNYAIFTGVMKKYMSIKSDGEIAVMNKYLANLLDCQTTDVYEKLEELLNQLLPKKSLHEYGVKPEEIRLFAESVMENQQRLLKNSFVPMTTELVESIYQSLY